MPTLVLDTCRGNGSPSPVGRPIARPDDCLNQRLHDRLIVCGLADLAFGLNETLAHRFMMASAQLPEAGIAAPSRPDITARGDTISACGRPRGNDVPTVGAASRQDIADHDD